MTVDRLAVNRLEITENVPYADSLTADLVGVGRADTLARGADLAAPLSRFVCRIQNAVRRQDQVCLL